MTASTATPRVRHRRIRELAVETVWSIVTFLLLAVRMVSTLTTAVLVMIWVIVAVKSDLYNVWFWPAVVSSLALLAATILYSLFNAR
ncbi:hypothetical protein [Williamsia sterculiae]|uniref:Uncharacterized protein n=1 Tax=Williamsia sterculiae TaxID=1344003 RepID=A0A1N7H9T4_9NOCA|nr:hypothetical protein [Williamsia sterculiae]SIS21639.1 hypothetical protein SAMN05445060_3796 [Williamsia sterculiae]